MYSTIVHVLFIYRPLVFKRVYARMADKEIKNTPHRLFLLFGYTKVYVILMGLKTRLGLHGKECHSWDGIEHVNDYYQKKINKSNSILVGQLKSSLFSAILLYTCSISFANS